MKPFNFRDVRKDLEKDKEWEALRVEHDKAIMELATWHRQIHMVRLDFSCATETWHWDILHLNNHRDTCRTSGFQYHTNIVEWVRSPLWEH